MKIDQKKYKHLPGIAGGVVTSVREDGGQVIYRYRVPPRVHEKQRRVARRPQRVDPDDIGQGEGCEGGKCVVRK